MLFQTKLRPKFKNYKEMELTLIELREKIKDKLIRYIPQEIPDQVPNYNKKVFQTERLVRVKELIMSKISKLLTQMINSQIWIIP